MAASARKHWERATQCGTPNATTTFHDRFDKRDFWSFSPTPGGEVEQYGARGMALGYLTKVRFVRYVRTREGAELTGVDCSKPGSDAESEARTRVICNEFFDLLVKYSRSHPHEEGDYGNVGRSRKLVDGSFCIFTGFNEALASDELVALRAQWKARYGAPSPPPPTESAPAQDWTQHPAYNAEFERLNTEAVKEVNAEIAARHPPPPPPPPEPAPVAALEFDYKTIASWSAETRLRFYEKAQDECVAQYKRFVNQHWHPDPIEDGIEVEAVSGCMNDDNHPLFVLQCKVPGRTSCTWRPEYRVFFKGVLARKRHGFRPLVATSVEDIRHCFGDAIASAAWARRSEAAGRFG